MPSVRVGATLVLGSALAACAAPPPRGIIRAPLDPADEREIATLRSAAPHAVALLDQGSALLEAGAFREAQALFLQAHTEYPNASILWRRDCEALTALGRREEAILACSNATQVIRTGPNVRAVVSALVDGPTRPTTIDLSEAVMLTATERSKGRGPVPAAAACDIAERIGDMVMLSRCIEELESTSPRDPALARALRVLDAECPPYRFWVGWGAILAAVVITVGHALRRLRFRMRSTGASLVTGMVLSAALLVLPGTAAAQPQQQAAQRGMLSKWPVDDEDPGKNVPSEKERNADPLQFGYWLQDVSLKGEHASKRGDHLAAARFYNVLAEQVPDRSIGFTRTCDEYELAGELDKAINMCAAALLRDGLRVKDYTHFVNLLVAKPGALSAKETAALAQVIAHMRADPAGQAFADDVECEVASRTSNIAQLKECTANLVARNPDDAKTISYLWALAVADGRLGDAQKLVERAKAAGVASEAVAKMQEATAKRSTERVYRALLALLALGFLAVGVSVAARALKQRRALKGAGQAQPPAPRPNEVQAPG
jgi:tetratricopeptide (TPR) repeat protein